MFHWYGFFIGLAIVVGWSVAEKIDERVSKAAPWMIGLGLVGARVWHVVEFWTNYSHDWLGVFRVWEGGMSIWGAIIGGFLALWIYFKGSTLKVMGAVVTALPLAQAIGRVGNGVNGEFTNIVWILPWWACEAVLDLILFVILRGSTSKYQVWVYLVGYGLIRLVLQPYRM